MLSGSINNSRTDYLLWKTAKRIKKPETSYKKQTDLRNIFENTFHSNNAEDLRDWIELEQEDLVVELTSPKKSLFGNLNKFKSKESSWI